jgi:hypothetical protein
MEIVHVELSTVYSLGALGVDSLPNPVRCCALFGSAQRLGLRSPITPALGSFLFYTSPIGAFVLFFRTRHGKLYSFCRSVTTSFVINDISGMNSRIALVYTRTDTTLPTEFLLDNFKAF